MPNSGPETSFCYLYVAVDRIRVSPMRIYVLKPVGFLATQKDISQLILVILNLSYQDLTTSKLVIKIIKTQYESSIWIGFFHGYGLRITFFMT